MHPRRQFGITQFTRGWGITCISLGRGVPLEQPKTKPAAAHTRVTIERIPPPSPPFLEKTITRKYTAQSQNNIFERH